jgi:hypothetical protein
MTNAGEGESSRLRIGGWLSEAEAEQVEAVSGEVRPPTGMTGTFDPDTWDSTPADVRDGPTFQSDDSWDGALDADEDERYRGRRRIGGPAGRLWIAIAFVLVGLGAAVAIPLALSLSSGNDAPPDPSSPAVAVNVPPSSEGSASPTATPGPSVSPSPSQPTTVAAPPFRPATYEAEAGTTKREGSARVRPTPGASGRKVVNRIGDWSDSDTSEANNGTLTFTEVRVPAAGTYTLAVYYAFLEEDPTRSMLITVNQSASRNVTVARPEGCCQSSVKISITLKKGVNTIRFSNSDGPAPAIDRILISQN